MLKLVATLCLAVLAGSKGPPPLSAPDGLSAVEILERAYEHAGGDQWVNPTSRLMEGYGLFWLGSEEFVRYEPYRMWRVYPEVKDNAHSADGRGQGKIDTARQCSYCSNIKVPIERLIYRDAIQFSFSCNIHESHYGKVRTQPRFI